MLCAKCSKGAGISFLVIGVLFLLRDWNVWNVFNIGAWSALFILVGMMMWGASCCKDCQSCYEMPAAKSSKKK